MHRSMCRKEDLMARERFSFWLDLSKDSELLIAETIDDLKAHRKFSWVVRTGIRIVTDLMRGRHESVIAEFPWLVDRIAEMLRKQQPDMTLTDEQWAVLRQLATAQPAEMLPQQSSPKPMDVPQFAMPNVDADDDDTLNWTQQTGGGSVRAMMDRVTEMMHIPAD